jgi:cytokinesis protein
MNDSTKQASGFKLGTLQRLAFTKDDKNTMTFLNYVEKIVHTSFRDLEGFVDDLKDAVAAANLSIEHLKADCDDFMKTIKNVQTSIDIGNLSDPSKFHPKDKVLSTVLSVLPEARKKREFLGDQLKTTMNEFQKLMRYFGEDPTDSTAMDNFFSKFASFVSEFEKARRENIQRERENRAYEARRRLQETPKKAKQLEEGKLDSGSGSNTSVMDSLIEKLKAAGPSGDARSARRRAAARRNMADRRALLNRVGSDGSDAPVSSPLVASVPIKADSNEGDGTVVDEQSSSTGVPRLPTEQDSSENFGSSIVDIAGPPNGASAAVSSAHNDDSGPREEAGSSQAPSEDADDIGGRARKLLMELRSGTVDPATRLSPTPASSNMSKLAERRARKAHLKSRSTDSPKLRVHEKPPAENGASVSQVPDPILIESSPEPDVTDGDGGDSAHSPTSDTSSTAQERTKDSHVENEVLDNTSETGKGMELSLSPIPESLNSPQPNIPDIDPSSPGFDFND